MFFAVLRLFAHLIGISKPDLIIILTVAKDYLFFVVELFNEPCPVKDKEQPVIIIDEKRKRLFLALAIGVLVFTGFQCFWYLTVDGSILQAMSIMVSIALAVTLLKSGKTAAYKEENCVCRQGGEAEVHALYAKFSPDCKVHCNREVAEYLTNIKNELDQAEQLVNEAVTNLAVNFNYIGELTTAQHDMALAIEEMAMTGDNAGVVKLLRRQMMVAKKIEQELATMATSMQVGDLVVQLLKHTARQINSLDSVLRHIDQHDNQEKNIIEPDDTHNQMTNTAEKMKKNNQRKPVLQQGVQSGEVELF